MPINDDGRPRDMLIREFSRELEVPAPYLRSMIGEFKMTTPSATAAWDKFVNDC